MKHAVVFLVFSLALTACNRRDAHTSKQITGTWHQKAKFESMTSDNTVIFTPDHKFSMTRRMSDSTNYMAGTWQVKDSVVLMTVTDAGEGNLRLLDKVVRIQIDDVAGTQFDYQDVFVRYGPTNTFYRQ